MAGPGVFKRACVVCALFYFVVLLVGATRAQAQMSEGRPQVDEKSETCRMDALCFAGTDSSTSRLDVFVQVGYEGLSFVKDHDQYNASFDATVTVYDSASGVVGEKNWIEEIKGATFDESVSSRPYRLAEKIFQLRPGLYSVTAIVTDRESKVTRRITRRVQLTDFSHRAFALSDVMLISRVTFAGDKRSILPIVGGNVGAASDQFYMFVEAYNSIEKLDSVRLVTTINNPKGNAELQADTVEAIHAGKNELLVRVDHSRLSVGEYVLMLKVLPSWARADTSAGFIGLASRPIGVQWRGVPRSIKDLDVAIEQLRYIAKDDEMDSLKAAKTPEEKQKRFFAFWQKRNLNPNAPRNVRMEEYYARVDYSNKHFSHYIDGWKTDMGMVYITFGPPNSVDRHPYDIDSKPYEIWSYYDLNHQFIFVDETGFGDYRLQNPMWDVWRRGNF